MGKPTLLLQWVIVIAVSQLHAVPVRDRGGVIYGTEFLKILDPRTRLPLTENEAESPPSTSSLLSEPTLRAPAAFETSTSSTISSASSSSSSSSSSSVRSRASPTARQKSRALNTLPLVSSSNDLTSIIKFGTKTTPSDTSAIQRTKSQPSTAPNKDNSTTNSGSSVPLSHDKNGTESVLDYDYYYYYMEDFSLQEDPKNSSAIKEAGTLPPSSSSTSQNDKSRLNSFRDITTPFTIVQVTTAQPQKARQTTTKATETTTSATSKPAITRTTRTTPAPVTTVPTRSRSPTKSTAVRSATNPPVSRPPFRYQTEVASESTTATTTAASEQPSTQEITLELDDTVMPSEPERESDDPKPRNAQSTTETTSSGNNVRSDARKLAAALRNLALTTPLPQATSQPPTAEDAVLAPTTPSTTTTSEPLTPKPNKRQQRPNSQRSSTNRNFRYTTTPLPKDEVASEDEKVTDLNVNEDTLQKSLGSATSSSIVVEVRVESPQPEARRMPSRKPQSSQTLGRNPQKGTPSPTKTVQSIDPEYRTTSFLLSDSLVVDLSSGPRTSDKQAEDTPLPTQRPSSRHLRTTTEKPESPVPSEHVKDEKNDSTNISPRRESSRTINARGGASQIQARVTELADSDSKTNPEVKVPSTANQNEPTTPKTESSSKPTQTQRHSISTSVLRTVAHTEAKVSSVNAAKPVPVRSTTSEKPPVSTTAKTSNVTLSSNQTLSTNTTTLLRKRPKVPMPHGISPQGLAPFGEAPGGLSPFGYAPEGLHPYGLHPTGLHPHGLAPHGGPTNTSTNTTKSSNNTRLTFVDATVAEGANSSVGYVAVEHNISRFRLEEKTPDGFIIGEYGEVDHRTGDVNGVRYTADSTADPNLIYDALIKFLNL